jgi:hypothetical protein
MTDVVLDLRQRDRKLLTRETDCIAVGAGASRTAYPMYIVRGVLRQVVVEYVTDIGDVQTAGSNISCYQHGQVAVVEVTEEA